MDPSPSVGVNTGCFKQLLHQLVVVLDVLTFQGHLITLRFVLIPEELIVVLRLREYDIINRDASCTQGCVQLIGKCDLPVVPAMVCPALAGIDCSDFDFAIIVFGFFALHGFIHRFVIPKFWLGYKPALVMVLNPMDQGLEPLICIVPRITLPAADGLAAMRFAISVMCKSLFN